MRLKLIACDVFLREAAVCLADSPHVLDVEFLELGEHVHSETLRRRLQERIDAASRTARPCDAVLLLYGICGNSTVGLRARNTPLVMPRAHDCCTILLGSRDRFRTHFQDAPSTPFSSAGYFERGEYYLRVEDGETVIHYGDAYAAYVEQYGEENARYIWDALHPRPPESMNTAVFIEIPETALLGYAEQFRKKAEAEGKHVLCLPGSLGLIRRLLHGQWDPEDFLVVKPGEQIRGVYDWSEIVRTAPGAKE